MTAHDEALHPRDRATGEFATKVNSEPDAGLLEPAMSPAMAASLSSAQLSVALTRQALNEQFPTGVVARLIRNETDSFASVAEVLDVDGAILGFDKSPSADLWLASIPTYELERLDGVERIDGTHSRLDLTAQHPTPNPFDTVTGQLSGGEMNEFSRELGDKLGRADVFVPDRTEVEYRIFEEPGFYDIDSTAIATLVEKHGRENVAELVRDSVAWEECRSFIVDEVGAGATTTHLDDVLAEADAVLAAAGA